MKLETCDIILWVNEKSDPLSRLSRWAIGPYSHVAMYLGRFPLSTTTWIFNVPLVYESRGRGVYIASLLPQTGALVSVMRPVLPPVREPETHNWSPAKDMLIRTAFEMAADEKHFYDYVSIVHSVLPRLIAEKLPWLPLPPIKYHRDIFYICSEAVAEVFWRNGFQVIPDDEIPLPGDFAQSPTLMYVGKGKLMEDVLP